MLFICSLCSFSVRNGPVCCLTGLQKSWSIHSVLLNEWLAAVFTANCTSFCLVGSPNSSYTFVISEVELHFRLQNTYTRNTQKSIKETLILRISI